MFLATSAVPGYGMRLRPVAMVEQLASPGEGSLQCADGGWGEPGVLPQFPHHNLFTRTELQRGGESCWGGGRRAGGGLWGQHGRAQGRGWGCASELGWRRRAEQELCGHVPGGQ